MTGARSRLAVTALAAALLLGGAPARAQEFPTRPVRMVVPYGPGGSTDVLARLYAARMGELLGQPVVVENRGGGGTLIGIRAVVQAPADGHTVLFSTSAVAINPLSDRNAGYRLEDMAPVAPAGQFPYVLLLSTSVPARTLAELVAYGRANPRRLNYSSLGPATPTQLLTTRFLAAAGLTAEEINYSGAAAGMNDVIAGTVHMILTGAQASNLRAERTRALAITGERRVPVAPDVPTFAELGYPTMLGGTWFGVFAPAGTPAPLVQRLGRAVEMSQQAIRERLLEFGVEAVPDGAEGFPAFIRKDQAHWEEDLQRLGLRQQ